MCGRVQAVHTQHLQTGISLGGSIRKSCRAAQARVGSRGGWCRASPLVLGPARHKLKDLRICLKFFLLPHEVD